MAQFMGGPAVRVGPNVSIEFKWITDVAWYGKVEVFTNPDGTGAPVLTKQSQDALNNPLKATQQVITVPVAAPLTPDTGYFFRVTATDPTGSNADLVTQTPLPPVFTGAQVLSGLRADSVTTSGATVAWQANVIGFGKTVFGTSQSVQDAFNITAHAIDLASLSPGTTYQFMASNKHAIDGDDLATLSGQFTTAAMTTTVVFTEPHAEPRVVPIGTVSTVSIRAKNQGNPVPGVVVTFAIDPGSAGACTLSTVQASTDSNGIASVQLTPTGSGLVTVQVTAGNAKNSPLTIPVVVR
jgi:hypothetical protein